MALIAGATIGAGALSAGSGIMGAGKASSAAKDAANTQKQMYLQTRADLAPYNAIGQTASGNALSLAQGSPTGGGPDYVGMAGAMFPGGLGGGSPGGGMSQAELEATPGYQFVLSQGQKAVQSAAAARGLGVSGASLKGAATYATGLADNTYQNQFKIAQDKFNDVINLNTAQQANLTNQFSRLSTLSTLGANAGAAVGTAGTNAASTAGSYINAAGVDQSNALGNASNTIAGSVNNYLAYNARQNALNPTAGGGTSGYSGGAAAGSPTPLGYQASTGNTWYS